MKLTRYTYQVRQVRPRFWTYDIYCDDGSESPDFSIGECWTKADAIRQAKITCKIREEAFNIENNQKLTKNL